MVSFPSFFDEDPDLSSAESIRAAMRESYAGHRELAGSATLPPNTSLHEASLYGVLSSFLELTGASPATTAEHEHFLWLDLLPFLHLPEEDGLTALIEYVLWKQADFRGDVQEETLMKWVKDGTVEAAKNGWAGEVREAMDVGGQGPLPWIRLLGGSLRR